MQSRIATDHQQLGPMTCQTHRNALDVPASMCLDDAAAAARDETTMTQRVRAATSIQPTRTLDQS
jgi:hypothetical protein